MALDAQVHDVVTADGTIVNDDVPSPESYSVPLYSINKQPSLSESYMTAHLLYLEALLIATICTATSLSNLGLGYRCICHIDVRHGQSRCGGCGEMIELLVVDDGG